MTLLRDRRASRPEEAEDKDAEETGRPLKWQSKRYEKRNIRRGQRNKNWKRECKSSIRWRVIKNQ